MQALLALSRAIDTVTAFVGYHVRWLILAAILVSAGNALMRKALSISSNAWLEAQWLLFGAVFMLAAAFTLQRNAHVRIDVLSSRFSKRTRDVIELLGHVLILLPFTAIFVWLCWPFFLESFREGEMSSNAGGLPVWPAKFLIFAGMLLLLAQAISEIIKRTAVLMGLIDDPAEQAVHGRAASETSVSGAQVE